MVNHNLRLVVKIAHQYNKYPTVPLIDLIMAGNVGLTEAVDKFKYSKGKFSTYSFSWIKLRVIQTIDKYIR
ncbi:RNA polymerase subunit sigma, partial [archaeon]|nr:RNA polymerase subunit sigma [archaeon]